MNTRRQTLQQFALALALAWLPGAASLAQSDPSKPLRVVLQGHDPVAYFTESKPVKGDPKISYE